MQISQRVHCCRVCNAALPEPFLDLGHQPLANNLQLNQGVEEIKVDLQLVRCLKCELVQLTETVAPEVLFRDYVWVSGTASTTRAYSEQFYRQVIEKMQGRQTLQVTEIASNDGTFLKPFAKAGHRVQGVDPARNIAKMAEESGIPTLAEFFNLSTAQHVAAQNGHSDLVIARNVIPHVAEINSVIEGIHFLLKDDGTGIIEFHDAAVIQRELHYDSVYHEHLFYFTLTTLKNLLERHQLYIYDCNRSPISGGSLVVYFSKSMKPLSENLQTEYAGEISSDINSVVQWQAFAERCALHREQLLTLLAKYQQKGAKIVGYGASARSSTLLNYCAIDQRVVTCIADQNPLKHLLWTPGSQILIQAPEQVFQEKPTVVLLLAWNFAEEILHLLGESWQFSGDVILPLPNEVRVVCM